METFSAYQIAPAASLSWRDESLISNLKLNYDLPILKPGSSQVLVNIRAAALNARDLMVIAHDSIYPIETIPNLSPCCDGAGVVAEVGERSVWGKGDKVVLVPQLGWKEKKWPVLTELKGRGAGDVEGTLREYIIVV
jgi:NADPH:quinone reductase-like Zn-dependent oxidoreductase